MNSTKADYGFDAPTTVALFIAISAALVGLGFLLSKQILTVPVVDASTSYWIGISFGITGLWMIIGSRVLKYKTRDKVLGRLDLKGTEKTLDVGCGRGLLLLGTAKKLTSGRAHGIDIWQTVDQSGNDPKVTLHNADCEGVREKVEIITGDARQMPFEDSHFDVLTSSWAIHNIPTRAGREKALSEMIRVLKPGGKIGFLDIKYGYQYENFFRGRTDVTYEKFGPDLTFLTPGYLFLVNKTDGP